MTSLRRSGLASLLLTITILLVATSPAWSGKKATFLGSRDAKEKDEPQKFLPDYDKLVEGKDADWVWFPDGVDLASYKTVVLSPFKTTSRDDEAKDAAEDGQKYLAQWLDKSPVGWEVVKSSSKGDLAIEGNVYVAWEPNLAVDFFAPEGSANPAVGVELLGRDAKGRIVFEIRHKSRGSTIEDAVENALENVVDEFGARK